MTILYPAPKSVKPARPFGLGLALAPSRRMPTGPTAADAAWWAENSPSNARGYTVVGVAGWLLDQMAEDDAMQAAYENGLAY